MSYKSEFNSIWKATIDQVKVDIDREAEFGIIDPKMIEKSYAANAKKWETSIYREGEWLEGIGNDSFSRDFIRELNDIDFTDDIPQPVGNYAGLVISAVGIASIFVLTPVFSVSWGISAGIGSGAAIGGFCLQKVLSKNTKEKYHKKIKEVFVDRVKNKGKSLENLIEKYGL